MCQLARHFLEEGRGGWRCPESTKQRGLDVFGQAPAACHQCSLSRALVAEQAGTGECRVPATPALTCFDDVAQCANVLKRAKPNHFEKALFLPIHPP